VPQSKRRFILGFIALIGLTIVVSLYYVWHKPISIPTAVRLSKAFGQLATALGLLSIGGGLGVRLTRTRMDQTGLAWMSVQAGLGCGILSLGVLVVGTTIGVGSFIAWLALIILGILLYKDIREWWSSLPGAQKIFEDSPRLGRWIAAGLGLVLLATLTAALAPPLKFDALVYHLSLPRFYLLNGRIAYTPWLNYWGMPQTGEMLYTWATALVGVEGATSLGWLLGVTAIVGFIGLVYLRFGAMAAWAGVAALCAGFTVSTSLAWAYVDWMTVLFGLDVLITLELWASTGNRRCLIVAGALSGMALGSKYTAGVVLLAGTAVVVWYSRKQGNKVTIGLRDVVYFLLPAMLISMPWWIKNVMATGTPFYPFFFPGGAMDLFRLSFYQLPAWGDWRDIVMLPVMASLTGMEATPGYSASIGPLLLGLSLFVLFGWLRRSEKERQLLRIAIVFGAVGLIVWVVAARLSGYLIQSRLYFVFFPALAVLAGAGFKASNDIQGAGIRLGRLVAALVLVVWGFSVFEVVRFALELGSPQEVLGITPAEDYIEDNLGWYARSTQVIKDLPDDASVLMLWEPRSLYCLPKCVPDEVIDRWKHDRAMWDKPDVILDQWRLEGYSHLLFNRLGAEFVREQDKRYSPDDWEALDKLLSNLPPPVDIGGAYYLYGLSP
jgi:hypothetical protein